MFAGLPDGGLGPRILAGCGPQVVYRDGWRRVAEPLPVPPLHSTDSESPVFALCCLSPRPRWNRLSRTLEALLGAYGWLSGNPLR